MTTNTDLVADVIQNGYGDATQGVLDRKVSRDIIDALRAAGWASPEEVRAIVAAAGGRLSVPYRILMDPPKVLFRSEDYKNDGFLLVTRDE